MVCRGTVRHGKIELDPGVHLPEGVVVRVEAFAARPDPADGLADEAVSTGIVDLAAEHDHYIYETPKREE